jgi:hypothetical protein
MRRAGGELISGSLGPVTGFELAQAERTAQVTMRERVVEEGMNCMSIWMWVGE